MERDELLHLVEVARLRNERAGITGALVYDDGRFLQLIEGNDEQVLSISAKIVADPRQEVLDVLSDEPAVSRRFGQWSMALGTPTTGERTPGYWPVFVPLTDPHVITDGRIAEEMLAVHCH